MKVQNITVSPDSMRFSTSFSASINNFQNSVTSNESLKSYILVVWTTHDMNLKVNIKPQIQGNTQAHANWV